MTHDRRLSLLRWMVALAASGAAALSAQQAPAPPPPAFTYSDYTGFEKIFDGTTLKNWDGDPMFWRVEGGAIVGQSTAEKKVAENTFLIYQGGPLADFDLRVEFRINSTNSGVQYRSKHLTTGVQGKWVLCGYQADIDFANQYTGMLYEERGRTFLARRGQVGYAAPTSTKEGQCSGVPAPARGTPAPPPAGPRGPIATLESTDALKTIIKVNDWNQFEVIARGNQLTHILNGHVTALFIDDDQANRALSGLLGFQMHMGEPMKVEFRNVYVKKLK